MIKTIHPFPARMAPDLALSELKKFKPGSVILDPMAGSGTVLRQACELGHKSLGFDLDPLAVLMARVWTSSIDSDAIKFLLSELMYYVHSTRLKDIYLPWIDDDKETRNFINFWFSQPQKNDLRRIAYSILQISRRRRSELKAATDMIKLSFSRLIITKNNGASLARDVSHSRPHRVMENNNFDVFANFNRTIDRLHSILTTQILIKNAQVSLGDARNLCDVRANSVDAILTSPPYLNAIDYMRGHRLALVWLGYKFSELREIRSNSTGAERKPEQREISSTIKLIKSSMISEGKLPNRYEGIVDRYAYDISQIMSETARVLKPGGKAIFVVGDSCLKNVFIKNSAGVTSAASNVGLKLVKKVDRELPNTKRYLPMPESTKLSLGKRMRIETVLYFKA